MNEVLLLNKQVGETPLACMDRYRAAHPEYAGVKMTYAGRLDPIASGLLLVLTGDKVHDKDSYLSLPKTYECTAILGVATDTYDVLGLPATLANSLTQLRVGLPLDKGGVSRVIEGRGSTVKETLEAFVGTFQQAYPPYSSKTVDGKQLHRIARDGDIDSVELPERMVTVSEIRDVACRRISRSEMRRQITDTVSRVTGDFRQEEILSAWAALLDGSHDDSFTTVSLTISVSGGTYIRGIVNSLGEKLGCGACILSLRRTKLGDFMFTDGDKP